ncbi:MAG: FAD-dependent oxidoreductase [Methylotenera sp.]|nr:FAD-dependent oxidoreductase [Methylotenera sp.]MSP99471.1 FAD-dependent oxidoreductase [Methylotenera sp.]
MHRLGNEVLSVDIAIVGAGLVGLSAAVALHQAGFSVLLVDSRDPTQTDDALSVSWDTRIYAISPKNAQWLNRLGVWPLLNTARTGEIQVMEIFADDIQAPLTLSASDENAENLAYVVEAKALMQALLKQVETLAIRTLFNSPCETVSATPTKATLRFANKKTVESALLLAADGSQSWLRQQLNMPMQQKSYEQTAIVANFNIEKSHANTARQWFTQEAGGGSSILAWLPLPDNTISIVWSAPTKLAESLLKLSEDTFTRQVMLAGATALGGLKLISPAVGFPLTLQKTSTPVQDCVVLVGDAAHQIHPMAGQGVNLGFRDVIDLITVLKDKNQYQALNDGALLKRYTRLRKTDLLNMLLLTDGLFQLFGSHHELIKTVRNWGWSATKQRAIKRRLVANAISL